MTTQRIFCIVVSVTASFSVTALSADVASIESVTPESGYEEIVARLRRTIRQEVADKNLPAFSISLVEGDRTVWAEGFGFRDADRKLPATASTVYRVGSISKLFTDIAVMQLVEQNKLSLDAPIAKYLPKFSPKNPYDVAITLRQLMSHRSGLVRESPVGHYFDATEPSLQATVDSLNQTSLVYEPGTKTKYSNAGIAVVGYLLEKKSAVAFSQRIEESVLKPLQMKSTSFELTPRVRRDLATAWMWTYDGRRFEAPEFLLGTAPAGNLYSSVLDLSKFLSAIFNEGRGENGQILKPETLQLMTSPQKTKSGILQRFGIGFHISQLDGHKKIGHGGAVYGFSTQLEALPERKLGVAAVASLDGSNGIVGRIADYALRLLLAKQDGKPLPEFESTGPVPAEIARQTAGRYESDEKLIQITNDDGRLFMRRGSFRFELRSRPDGFVVDDVLGYGPKIERESTDSLVIDGAKYVRVADQKPDRIPDRWKGLIGEYGWDHNTLYILEDRGRLVALIEWFYFYPLKELSDNEFAFPDYGLYHGEGLKFTRDDRGNATQVVAAEVLFKRRSVGTRDGETFRIEPVKPIDDLRAAARKAQPPKETGNLRDSEFVELTKLDPTIKLDIRYATTNNFTGAVFYKQPRAFMQRPAAEAVVRAHRSLKEQGLGLLIHDAYRPWYVTKMFWDATPSDLKQFVANPRNGSRHNRGCAVDLTLYDLKTGLPIPMVASYDEFSPRSFPNYPGGTSRQRWHRTLLRKTMEAAGFSIYEFEWWHFDFKDWQKYRIHNLTFEEILKSAAPGEK